MKREQIKVEKRTIVGRKIKSLRRDGILPANVYGKDLSSISVQLPLKSFKDLYKKVKETGLVDLEVDSQTLPVLIHNVQIDPKSQDVLHADFYKVNLLEKITSQTPLVSKGEPLAQLDKKGILLTLLSELEVEALPTDLPEKIEVDVSKLAEVNDQITVADVSVPTGVTILNEPSQVLFKIGELVQEEPVEEVPVVETPAEGEVPSETPQTSEAGEAPAKES